MRLPMPVKPDHVLLGEVLAQISPNAQGFATLLYERLFARHPELAAMFQQDMAAQRHRVWQALKIVVSGYEQRDTLVPVLERLGVRHIGYGVCEAHYPLVGAVLLETVGQAAVRIWTPDHEAAWERAVAFVAEHMLAGARKSALTSAG